MLGIGGCRKPILGCDSINLGVATHEHAWYLETVRPRRSDPEEVLRPPGRPDDGEPDGTHPS